MRSDNIKAKETTYQGIVFRSKTEARFAKYLDSLGVAYLYEPHEFDLGGAHYTPDFFLPEIKTLVEIKPEKYLEEAKKIKILSRQNSFHNYLIADFSSGELKLFGYGNREQEEMFWHSADGIKWVFCSLCAHPYILVYEENWSCKRCGFYAKDNTYCEKQPGKILPVNLAKEFLSRHLDINSEIGLPEILLNPDFRRAVFGLDYCFGSNAIAHWCKNK